MSSAKPDSSRRDFLKGKAAVDALAARFAGEPIKTPAKPPLLVQVSRGAMATEFQVLLNAHQHQAGPEAAVDALDIVEELEDQLSVYRSHSEVSRLNREAGRRAVPVELGLFGLLRRAGELWRATGGAFDITAGPLSRAWGFHQRRGHMPNPGELEEALRQVGAGAIELHSTNHSVRFTKAALEINLGAIGKGYALDRAAEVLEFKDVADFVLHGGRSSVLARGSQRGRQGWQVALMHPLRPQQALAELTLEDRALATSGCGNQFFHHQGRRLSHILDPRNGKPAEGVLSATALADSAADADALATAMYVLGPEASSALVERLPDVAALLVLPGSKSGAVQLLPLGLEADQWRPIDEADNADR